MAEVSVQPQWTWGRRLSGPTAFSLPPPASAVRLSLSSAARAFRFSPLWQEVVGEMGGECAPLPLFLFHFLSLHLSLVLAFKIWKERMKDNRRWKAPNRVCPDSFTTSFSRADAADVKWEKRVFK